MNDSEKRVPLGSGNDAHAGEAAVRLVVEREAARSAPVGLRRHEDHHSMAGSREHSVVGGPADAAAARWYRR